MTYFIIDVIQRADLVVYMLFIPISGIGMRGRYANADLAVKSCSFIGQVGI
jgi:hypothetical protein